MAALALIVRTELSYRWRKLAWAYGFFFLFALTRLAMITSQSVTNPDVVSQELGVLVGVSFLFNALLARGLVGTLASEVRPDLVAPLPLKPGLLELATQVTVMLLHGATLVIWGSLALVLITLGLWPEAGTIHLPTVPATTIEVSCWTPLALTLVSFYFTLIFLLEQRAPRHSAARAGCWILAIVLTSFLVYPAGSSAELFLPGFGAFNEAWGSFYYLLLVGALWLLFRKTRPSRRSG